jgi:hypothetical protein
MEPERFYHFQFVDLFTHNFAYVGTLTSGNGAGAYLIAGPSWGGAKPEGVDGIVRSETGLVFCVTRTQLFGPDDLENVKDLQSRYDLKPLGEFLGGEAAAESPMPDFPQWAEGAQFDERFFGYFDFMLELLEAPLPAERALWKRLARLGLGADHTFDYGALSPEIQNALKAGVEAGLEEIENFVKEIGNDPLASAKIFGTREFLQESAKQNFGQDDHYLIRAAAAHLGLYGNSGHEAIYPTYLADAGGRPYDASSNRYTLAFEAGKLPPVKAFWSLTMYEGRTQLFVPNPLDRYLLNSTMMDQFTTEADGSLVLHIARQSPGGDLDGNWLPAPDGPFYLVLRLYGPEPEALSGAWVPPVLKVVD